MTTAFTPERIIGPDAIARTGEVLARHAPNARTALLVCDDTTWVAAGERIRLAGIEITPYSLGRSVKPKRKTVQTLTQAAAAHDVLLAVGAGTINDLTKYAAHHADKPYITIATAASMNGYTSATVSIEEDGFRYSHAATPPRAVVADTAVLSAAPKRMTRAGLGDTLCRSSVEADMLMSHHLLGTPYPRALFDIQRTHEASLIANATAARTGEAAYVTTLMHALLDAGDAMATFGSSATSSQSEHMIAHTLELMYGAELYDVLHGELIALTTIATSKLQQKLLLSPPMVRYLPREMKLFDRLFGKKTGERMFGYYEKKLIDEARAGEINQRLTQRWSDIKTALSEIIVPPNTVERAFIQSGLAVTPRDIGLDDERFRNACTYAYMTRDRFTCLDLAVMNDKRVF